VSSRGDIGAVIVGAILLTLLYLAPMIVAIFYKSGNLIAVILVDLLLGWTVIGWIVAWVLCFTGERRTTQLYPAFHAHPQPVLHGLSPDGMFWWDGIAWRDTRVVAPPHAPRSADGHWWWDGARWRPMPPPPPPVG